MKHLFLVCTLLVFSDTILVGCGATDAATYTPTMSPSGRVQATPLPTRMKEIPFNPGQETIEARDAALYRELAENAMSLQELEQYRATAQAMPRTPIPTITPGPPPTFTIDCNGCIPFVHGVLDPKPTLPNSCNMAQNEWRFTRGGQMYSIEAGDQCIPDGSHPEPEQGYVSIEIRTPHELDGWPAKLIGGSFHLTPTRDGPARIIDAQVDDTSIVAIISTNTLTYELDVLNETLTLARTSPSSLP
jgi:hypothetical protein